MSPIASNQDFKTIFSIPVTNWFLQNYKSPSKIQSLAWPTIHQNQSVLIAAPTGSGKTLAAFLAMIDKLVRQGLQNCLEDELQILYISPLKALSNDIQKNLQQPLEGISQILKKSEENNFTIRALTRTGDTSQAQRTAMVKHPPHILATTPESLYLLLTSDSGRKMLSTVHSVIIDEIHALAGNKRGAHLMLSVNRLDHLIQGRLKRIGLSATQKPIRKIADFLMGNPSRSCHIFDIGHRRKRQLQIEVTQSPLEALMANEIWVEIYDRLEQLIGQHQTTLIFVNTRRMAERMAAALSERLGETAVTAHHGSLAKEHRLDAEQRLKQGSLKALVSTAALELGIDIGNVDLVCQMGSPRSISTFLQRVGRSGHQLNAIPKGCLFPLSREDLLECCAILYAIKKDQLDDICIPNQPLDVLAQQIIAEISAADWKVQDLYQMIIDSYSYQNLSEDTFQSIIKMLAEGFHTQRGRRSAYLHYDAVNRIVRARKSARLTALLNGGAIPDQFDFQVILQPEGICIGSLNEDFAIESLPGDIFQLGNISYRILKIEQGQIQVENAEGQPPNIPFWLGEAPGRSDVLSRAVSDLSDHLEQFLKHDKTNAVDYLQNDLAIPQFAAQQLNDYLLAGRSALGAIPNHRRIIFERFLDETGDMHLVIHSTYGSCINKAWGLALRKRFCRKFNFELQAAAGENTLVLSLGPTHSFPILEPAEYLKSTNVESVLIQALLDAPMFATRWRWVCNTALAVPRNNGGKRVPAIFQRNNAEDLAAIIFPDQLACLENIRGEREIPEHPLVEQTLTDCLTDLMDIQGLIQLLKNFEEKNIDFIGCDLTAPSVFAEEILNARPYAFLDDAPAEERRTQAIQQRRFHQPEDHSELAELSQEAIDHVKEEAWPLIRNQEELHDALCIMGFMTAQEAEHYSPALFSALSQQRRICQIEISGTLNFWVATERLPELISCYPESELSNKISLLSPVPAEKEIALQQLIQSRMEVLGPVTEDSLSAMFQLEKTFLATNLLNLQEKGLLIQGYFTPTETKTEWCERNLLARIHRYTLKQLRQEIDPVSQSDFMQFLFDWHGINEPVQSQTGLLSIIEQLEGLSLPAASWEQEIFPRRIKPYFKPDLDQLCQSGRITWLRLNTPNTKADKQRNPVNKSTGISLIPRSNLNLWTQKANPDNNDTPILSSNAEKVMHCLKNWGASFFQELQADSGLLKTQLELALGELIANGLITADSYQGLRQLIQPANQSTRRHRRKATLDPMMSSGRWSIVKSRTPLDQEQSDREEHIASILLKRYGIVFRALLKNESMIPDWYRLLYIFKRMEARGEIRGGRFVQGFSGEQFALPSALARLRHNSKQTEPQMVIISATDPLNLTHIISCEKKISSQSQNRILFINGKQQAWMENGEFECLPDVEDQLQFNYKKHLLSQP